MLRKSGEEIAIILSRGLLVLALLMLLGALPTWPYSSGWGYYPSGGMGVLLLVLIILMFGRTREVQAGTSGRSGNANEEDDRITSKDASGEA